MSAQTIDYDSLAQQHGAIAAAPIDYDALAAHHGAQGVSAATSKSEPGFLDREIPLSSYGNATLSGVQSIGRAARDVVQGVPQLIKHPLDAIKGITQLPGQVAQVPGAISDINASADSTGTYAKVAQETAAQGGVQAALAAGTEGLVKGAAVAARPVVQGVSKAAESLNPDVIGLFSPRGANAVRLAQKAGKVFTKAGEEAPEYGAPVYRDATLTKTNIPDYAGEEIADAPKSGSPVYRDATKQNVPYAGEEIASPKPNTAPVYRDATKENVPYAGEMEAAAAKLPKGAPQAAVLKQAEALKQPVRDIVDSAIPPTGATQAVNMQTKAQVEFYLQRGNVEAANKVLNDAASKVNPDWPPERPALVPSTNQIREQLPANVAARRAELLDDKGIQQEMSQNLEQHGAAAESEARRQFIAGNSTGMTKGELIRRARIAQTPPEVPQDLTDEWTKALEEVKRIQGKK